MRQHVAVLRKAFPTAFSPGKGIFSLDAANKKRSVILVAKGKTITANFMRNTTMRLGGRSYIMSTKSVERSYKGTSAAIKATRSFMGMSRVKAHTRITKRGKVARVKSFTRKRRR